MATRIQEIPHDERPREKLHARGPGSLTDAELLAIFIRTGTARANAIDVARELVASFGSLHGIARASAKELTRVNGIGPAKASELAAAIELGTRLAQERAADTALDSPAAVYDLVAPALRALDRERVLVLLVNTKHRLIHQEDVSTGSLNESIAHPREILKPAILHSAHGFVLVHNHPSGDPTPSAADRQVTRRLAEVARELQISFLDHVIVGQAGDAGPYFSFREAGLL